MKNHLSRRFLFVAAFVGLCAITFYSCEKQSVVSPEPDTILGSQTAAEMPLAIGNTWVYRTTSLDQNGTILKTSISISEIVGERTVGNQQWFVLCTTESGTSSEVLVTNINGAQYYRNSGDTIALLSLKYPSASSESYTTNRHFPGILSYPDTIIRVPYTISLSPSIVRVPIGRFFAFKYTFSALDLLYRGGVFHEDATEMYFSDIGTVESISYGKSPNGQYVSGIHELIDVKIK
jgi:hypothetical protein